MDNLNFQDHLYDYLNRLKSPFNEENINKIEVSNMIGEILFEQNVNGILNSKFDLSHLNSGVYFINLYGEKTEITKKVFIK